MGDRNQMALGYAMYTGIPHFLENLESLENYGCPGMSWESPGKTQSFRLSWSSGILIKCPGKVLECLCFMEFGFLWQSFNDQL